MYLDKKLREHTLLQAIARTNRVKKGKQRGYIVDYIGLANHLTEALTLYAASDEMQELHDDLEHHIRIAGAGRALSTTAATL